MNPNIIEYSINKLIINQIFNKIIPHILKNYATKSNILILFMLEYQEIVYTSNKHYRIFKDCNIIIKRI